MLDQEMLEQKLYKRMYKNLKEAEKYLVLEDSYNAEFSLITAMGDDSILTLLFGIETSDEDEIRFDELDKKIVELRRNSIAEKRL